MVYPVTGPFTKSIDRFVPFEAGLIQHREYRLSGHRQKRPYNLPLVWSMSDKTIYNMQQGDAGTSAYVTVGACYTGAEPSISEHAYNEAYSKFKSRLGEAASLAVTLAERKQAMQMITSRLTQLVRFTRAVKSFRFLDAANILGVRSHPEFKRKYNAERGFKKTVTSFSNNYLEFHFGWAPLVGDIGKAIATLDLGIPPLRISGKGKRYLNTRYTEPSGNPFYPNEESVYEYKHFVHWTLRTQISVSNENHLLSSRLGFNDLIGVAWELVPFSFVVDWFANVSQYLAAFTDFHGLTLINPNRTMFATTDHFGRYYYSFRYQAQTVTAQRSVGPPPGPILVIREPWILSPRRGLAAASLLGQLLRH